MKKGKRGSAASRKDRQDRLKIAEKRLCRLLEDVERDHDRLVAEPLTLRYVWQPAEHPYPGKLWELGYGSDLDGYWCAAGHYFGSMALPINKESPPYDCQIYLVGGESDVCDCFTRHCREAEAIFRRMAGDGTRFNWANELIDTFRDAVDEEGRAAFEWRENEELDRPETLSYIAELRDVFEWTRILLTAFKDGAELRQQSPDGHLPRGNRKLTPKKRGRKPATVVKISEACRVYIAYQTMGLSQNEFCQWWNRRQGEKAGCVEVGTKWLQRQLAFVRKLIREQPDRIPKEFANKIERLRTVKRDPRKKAKKSKRTS